MNDIDNSDRCEAISARIRSKASLSKLYQEFYLKYADSTTRGETSGLMLEIGSGAGFLKDIVPGVLTTDILPYKTVDLVMDASRMPFEDSSIVSIFMLNTLHHIANSKAFFYEVERCLKPYGRVFIIDQYHGWFSSFIFKNFHKEFYDPESKDWDFETTGPLSGANGALSWIIFFRDRQFFERLYPTLKIKYLIPHTPLRYWLSGGLKRWQLLPGFLFGIASRFDFWLSRKFPSTSSFVDIELVKIPKSS